MRSLMTASPSRDPERAFRRGVASPDAIARSVLIVDEDETSGARTGTSFEELGCAVWVENSYAGALSIAQWNKPDLITTELRVGGVWAFDTINPLRDSCAGCAVVVTTAYPSVATAMKAIQLGFDGYFSKPIEVRRLLDRRWIASGQGGGEEEEEEIWPSLDRTIWEYINQVFVSAGTVSEAARRLKLDRRSLRRMLAKYPPTR
jgi:two-component system, response regulator RegA